MANITGIRALPALVIFFAVSGSLSADEGATAYSQGWKAVEDGKFDDALRLFEEATELAPSNGTYRRFIGWVLYSKLGRHEEALPHLRQAREMIPDDIGVHLDYALTVGELKLHDEMFQAYGTALGLYRNTGETPPEWIFVNCAATALFELSTPDIDRGKRYLELAVEFDQPAEVRGRIHSWISSAYQNRGWAANNAGNREEALDIFSKAYAHDSENAGNISGYGYILRETGQLDRSKAVLLAGRTRHPGDVGIRDQYNYTLQSLAWRSDENGDTGTALELFREALKLDPDNQWAINGFGAMLNKSGDHHQAVDVLERGYRLYPESKYIPGNLMNALRSLGDELWESGRELEADKEYRRALAIDPEDFWTNLTMYYNHRLAEKTDTKDLAEKVIELIDDRLVTEQSESVKAFYINYGNYLFSKLDVSHAREILGHGLELFPDDPFIYSALAFTYFRIDMDTWREMSERTLKMVPSSDQKALGFYQFPLNNERIKVTQGNHGGISHLGLLGGYAWDFVVVDESGKFSSQWEGKENHYIYGAAVYAAADGVVEYVNDSDPDTEPGENDPLYSGNVINIRHENGEVSVYVHLRQHTSLVRMGDAVRQGQQIAEVGCSGRYVDFPHLHFQVNRANHSVETKLMGIKLRRDDGWIDPGPYVPQGDDTLKPDW